MTFSEYFKLGTRNLTFILFITLFCAFFGIVGNNIVEKGDFNNSLFFTISIQDKSDSSDAYSNLQASDQFTESLQGWFKDPSLLKSIGNQSHLTFAINAKKQEKNNLIISFKSDTIENAKTFKEAINSEISKKISAYNSNSDIRVFITSSELHSEEQNSRLIIFLLIATFIGLIFGYVAAYYYEIFTMKLLSKRDFIKKIKPANSFSFSSYKKFKLEHHFLTTYINNKYKHKSIQLLDLTHKSKVGIEVLSKYGDFQEIKSFDLPSDLSKVNPENPTIIICELGKTSIKTLELLKTCGFNQTEGILFDRV
jgi:capsular polysaccharide biosynthesis protein